MLKFVYYYKDNQMRKKEINISQALQDCINCKNVSREAYVDVDQFLSFLEAQRDTASKITHYDRRSFWSDHVFGFVRNCLTKYGFVNAGAAMGIKQNPNADFWWKIYGLISNVCYSANLRSKVANHHSSAWERNEALITDVKILISKIMK